MRTSLTRGTGALKGRRQHGVALLEALIGFLIFSIGVLGLVGLQASMTRAQTSAKVRADAALLASELVGYVWADVPGSAARYAAGCNAQPSCDAWQKKVAEVLPAGTGAIAHDPDLNVATITVGWTQPGEGDHQMVVRAFVPPAP